MSSLDTRLRRLEDRMPDQGDAGAVFTVDISADPPHYWIDGRAVSWQEFEEGAPRRGPFTVEIGDNKERTR